MPEYQLRLFRRLINLIDAGEILDLAGQRLLVEALGIARDTILKRRIDENLDEFALVHEFAHHPAVGSEGRDEGAENDQPRIGHQLRHLADAADVLDPIGLGEAKILVQPVADVIAIEQDGMDAAGMKLRFDADWRWSICPSRKGR